MYILKFQNIQPPQRMTDLKTHAHGQNIPVLNELPTYGSSNSSKKVKLQSNGQFIRLSKYSYFEKNHAFIKYTQINTTATRLINFHFKISACPPNGR